MRATVIGVAVGMVLLGLAEGFVWTSSDSGGDIVDPSRHSRFFRKFLPFVKYSVTPDICIGPSKNASGTCFTPTECQNKGGEADGTCAAGFGVCCVIEAKCGSTIRHNMTYIINDEYPRKHTSTGNCQYSIEKMNENVCQLRLDMEVMILSGPSAQTVCSEDTFTAVGTAGANPMVICGVNTGQHMYLNLGTGSASARVNIGVPTEGKDRVWRIKVTQIPCDSRLKAPSGCMQYYTEYSGTINTFNYQVTTGTVHQLSGQRYAACIQTKEGFCGITYKSTDFSLTVDSASPTAAVGDSNCDLDYVVIPGLTKAGVGANQDRYCGSSFSDLTTYSKPFEVRIVTDDSEAGTEATNRGFSMTYMQIPC